jgi:glycosyltransferase involved in cell wall biosynthesis
MIPKRHRARCHVRTLHGSCFDEALHIRGVKERVRMGLLGVTELAAAVRTPIVVGDSRNSIRPFPWLRRIVHLGVDTDVFHPGGEPATAPTVLFVGTYENRKRGRLLCEVFDQVVRPAVPDARLWMVCTDAPAREGVEVLGRLSERELADRYRAAWVFCLPSSYEGFGLPYIEALASGTPVVASPNPGARELLDGRASAAVVADDDLGMTLVALLTDGPRRERMREHAVAEAERWSWQSVVDAYASLYVS